ncbi:MAG: mechanosensitive ion channel [Prevotellaceae bacterium]|nr:mechanosensitive ion channel [Candidatus Minthosoma caballi]
MKFIFDIIRSCGLEGSNFAATYYLVIFLMMLIVAVIFYFICRFLSIPLQKMAQRTKAKYDDIVFAPKVQRYFSLFVPISIVNFLLPYFIPTSGLVMIIIDKVLGFFAITFFLLTISALLGSAKTVMHRKGQEWESFFQMLQILVMCIGAIVLLSYMTNKNISAILAGLGASAAVLMLVFKDFIVGFVASMQLHANDMVKVGDWITIPKHNADGIVQKISLTTVKVQNYDNTIMTVPTAELVTGSMQNWKGMQDKKSSGRRVKRSLPIDMDTIRFATDAELKSFSHEDWFAPYKGKQSVTNLTLYRAYLESFLKTHDFVNKNALILVRLLPSTAQGLPLEIYFFCNDKNWKPYEIATSEIYEQCIAAMCQFDLRTLQCKCITQ